MMKKSTAYIIIAVLSVALIVTGLFAWNESQNGLNAMRAGQSYGSVAMGELASSLNSMDEALRESTYATNAPLFSQLCAKAAANASGAVSALAAMPYTTTELEKLSGYINSAGDWALWLSREGAEGRLPDEETMEQLREISESVSDLAAQATQLGTQFSEGALKLDSYAACADDAATPPATGDTLAGQPVRFTATGLTVTPAGVTQTKADADFNTMTVYMTDTDGNTWQADYKNTNDTWEADGDPLYWPTSTGEYTFTAISPAGTDPHITLPTAWTEADLAKHEAIRATSEAESTSPTEDAISLTLGPALVKVQVVSTSGQPVHLIDAPMAGTLNLTGSVSGSATTGIMTLHSPDNIVSEGYVLPAGEGFGFLTNKVYQVKDKPEAGTMLTICDDEEVKIINCAEAGKLTWPTDNPAKVLITGTINDDDMDEIEKHKDVITHLYVTASINKGKWYEGQWSADMGGDSENPSPLQVVCLTQATEIGDGAFSYCPFTTVSLPEATDIGGNAFASCDGLQTISLPKAKQIEGAAFQNSDNLTSICLPKGVQIYYNGYFDSISSLLTTLFLSDCTEEDFKEETYKNYLGITTWTDIYYGYKGTGDYLDENNYTGHWTKQ